MSDLTRRLTRLAKEVVEPGEDYKPMLKAIKEAYYGATEEGKKNMIEGWDKDGL